MTKPQSLLESIQWKLSHGAATQAELNLIAALSSADPGEALLSIIHEHQSTLMAIIEETETGIYQPQDALANIARFARKKL